MISCFARAKNPSALRNIVLAIQSISNAVNVVYARTARINLIKMKAGRRKKGEFKDLPEEIAAIPKIHKNRQLFFSKSLL